MFWDGKANKDIEKEDYTKEDKDVEPSTRKDADKVVIDVEDIVMNKQTDSD